MDNLLKASKEYANSIVTNKNSKEFYTLLKKFYTTFVFPGICNRFTQEDLKIVPISSEDIFEDKFFIDIIQIKNLFELVTFCAKSSSGLILDYLEIPGLKEDEPEIGYDTYMSITLYNRIIDKDYDESVNILSEIILELDMIDVMNQFMGGEIIDKVLEGQLKDFRIVIDDVMMTQVYKVLLK